MRSGRTVVEGGWPTGRVNNGCRGGSPRESFGGIMAMCVLCCSMVVFVEATGQESRWWKWETRRAKIARLEMSSRDGPASAPELRIKLVDYSNSRKETLSTNCLSDANTTTVRTRLRMYGLV